MKHTSGSTETGQSEKSDLDTWACPYYRAAAQCLSVEYFETGNSIDEQQACRMIIAHPRLIVIVVPCEYFDGFITKDEVKHQVAKLRRKIEGSEDAFAGLWSHPVHTQDD